MISINILKLIIIVWVLCILIGILCTKHYLCSGVLLLTYNKMITILTFKEKFKHLRVLNYAVVTMFYISLHNIILFYIYIYMY